MKKFTICLFFSALPLIGTAQSIIFVSDTQKPMWIEDVFLKSNQNEKATETIFHSILEKKPSAVYILGDVVSLGHKEKKWKKIDAYLQLCRSNNIAVHALLGNHDVMGNAKKGEQVFQKRFSDHRRLGYVSIVDSIAVVLLNSNFKSLTEAERLQQKKWLEVQLDELDLQPAVRFVVVSCHHAPYTNSKIVRSSTSVQSDFVPAYLKSKKAILFITGHSHNFERFVKHQKNFLVIGGGGGIHQPTRASSPEMNDLAQDYKPMFHYLCIDRTGKKILLTSIYLNDSTKQMETGYRFELP